MAWLDPMCGLMLAFIAAAALWRRRTGTVARVDFSMIEAMLWTMAQPLLAEQLSPSVSAHDRSAVYRTPGPDEWLAVADAGQPWPADGSFECAASRFTRAGIPAAALARSADLVACPHLRARSFWDSHGSGVLPGIPWIASFGRATGPAPGLGADTDHVLREVAGLSAEEVAALRETAAIGSRHTPGPGIPTNHPHQEAKIVTLPLSGCLIPDQRRLAALCQKGHLGTGDDRDP